MYTIVTEFLETITVEHFDSLRDVSHAFGLYVVTRVKDPTTRDCILSTELKNEELVHTPLTVTYTDPDIGVPVTWHVTKEKLYTVLYQNELSKDVAAYAYATEAGARAFIDNDARKIFGMGHLGKECEVVKNNNNCLIVRYTDEQGKSYLISWEINS